MLWFLAAGSAAWAGGPRYVTGPPFFTGPAGVPIGWRQANLLYYTDPGDLSSSVNHAAADALVAAAAGVWNVPVASISVGQGGELAEHVSGNNVYLSSGGMVWPADVESSNAAAIPVAVVYDSDGSVTDTLLGSGASEPAACEQNAVTETVDAFDPAGYILHAIVVVNGRCTGPLPEQQLQMQYKLERAFGRVLGLAWSQTNDNVFIGTPQPTYNQANHWPIMHPLEILCGPYSYQCLPNAFTLRPDDIAGLVSIYPIGTGITPAMGKQASLADATTATGWIAFPDGEGMSGVNLLMVRETAFTVDPEGWYEVSAVSGSLFHTGGSSPFVSPDTSALGSMGSTVPGQRGIFDFSYFALLPSTALQNEILSTEPVNPLYTGAASVGVYAAGMVAPAGSAPTPDVYLQAPPGTVVDENFAVADAPVACGDGADGTPAAPMEAPPSGWWNGLLCGFGHASYAAVTVKAGRSLTVEVTALDANGLATTTKAMPVIGLFAPTDAVGALPSLGVAATAFNSVCVGLTQLNAAPFATGGAGGVVRVGVADERGDGRPDFPYQTRVFYADSISPSEVPVAGGATLTISGMGFRAGNEVLVNGVEATVVSWTSTVIVVTAPSMTAVGATAGMPVNVEIQDFGTGATSTMTGALTYGTAALPNTILLVAAETAPSPAGSTAAVPLTVQVLEGDGITPVMGDVVVFSITAGSAHFGVCGASTCTVTTDANGMATTTVVPLAVGPVTMQAYDAVIGGARGTVSASFTADAQVTSLQILYAPAGNQVMGQVTFPPFGVEVFGVTGAALGSQPVTFSVAPGSVGNAEFSPCNASPCTTSTNIWGGVAVNVTPTAAGAITLVATSGTATAQASFTAVSPQDKLTLIATPAATAFVYENAGSMVVQLTLSDGVTVLPNVPLTFSAPAGILFSSCGLNVCPMVTDYSGRTGCTMQATAPGTYTLTASYGALAVSVQLVVTVPQPQLLILSAPTGDVPVGTLASEPFTAQLLDAWGNPLVGAGITLGGPLGAVSVSCEAGAGSCVETTDSNGIVSTMVTPLQAGVITLEAVYLNLVAQASFTSVGTAETFTLVTPPPATVNVGTPLSFTLKGIEPDGVTPVVGHPVFLATTSGDFGYQSCAIAACKLWTGTNGEVVVNGTAWQAGTTTIQASLDGIIVVVTFNVVQPTQTLNLVSEPSGNYYAGRAIPAFVVKVVGPDGVTGVNGQNVTFSASAASGETAGISACTMPCVVQTGVGGVASSGAIGVSGLGSVMLTASDNGMVQTAQFTVVPAPDVVTLQGAPASVYRGATAAQQFAVKVTLADGATPVAGMTVILSLGAGSGGATFAACGAATCTLTTNAAGVISSQVAGTQSGSVALIATAQLPTGAAAVSATLLVETPDVLVLSTAPANVFQGLRTTTSFAVKATLGDGVTPLAGITVNVSLGAGSGAGTGAATFAACGAASCALTTNASGVASSQVTGTQAGIVTLEATAQLPSGAATVSAPLVVEAPDVLTLSGTPGSVFVTLTTTMPFAATVTLADGITPVAGIPITLSLGAGSGTAVFAVCGAATCALTTNAAGMVSSQVTGTLVGSVSLVATAQLPTGAKTVSETLLVEAPNVLNAGTAPASVFEGVTAATPFSVAVTLADKVTPVAGVPVSFSLGAGSGAALFTACGAVSCALTTNAAGVATSQVMGTQAGSLTLVATAQLPTGAKAVSSSLVVEAPDLATLLTAPSSVFQGLTTSTPFAVTVTLADGVTPVAGIPVTLSLGAGSGTATFAACGSATCALTTNAAGVASSPVSGVQAGSVNLLATAQLPTGLKAVSASLVVEAPDVATLATAPSRVFQGLTTSTPFAVTVTLADGVTPVAGIPVILSLGQASGAAVFAACGTATCALTTNAAGVASSQVTGMLAGSVSLMATAQLPTGPKIISAPLLVQAPDVVALVTAPANVYLGATTTTAFAMLVTLADKVTPVAGIPVSFSLGTGSGAAMFTACGAASCVLTTDAAGIAWSQVTGTQVGSIVLVGKAQLPTGTKAASATLVVAANVFGVTAVLPQFYIAAGATVAETLSLLAVEDGNPAAGQTATWTGSTGFVTSGAASTTDATGAASMQAELGPLSAGASASVSGCVWSTMCARFTAAGVSNTVWQVEVVSGGNQTVSGGGSLNPVLVEVTDGFGHAVQGATVIVGQTVRAFDGTCPADGRCPLGAVLGSAQSSGISDANGLVSVTPTVLPGVATTTSLAFSTGLQGFATAVVSSVP